MNKLVTEVKEKGGRMTRQRQAVLNIVNEAKGEHLTPEQVCDRLKHKGETISLATVYRTLILLDELGFLKKVYLNNSFRYEIKEENGRHSHHHLICTECGSVTEIHAEFAGDLDESYDDLEELESKIEQKHNFKILDHSLQFFGLCRRCRK
jgi:Fur family ferric uptake transcriptional regulator